ncbi:MAG: hypothetical protein HHJ13_01830 [Phycicoccus sp.]|nr:hypothetical protein [Phycicoccus sp.]
MGGIGKSALLIELAARVRSEPAHGATVVPIELHSANAALSDPETALLAIRAGLGAAGGRWEAFDIALSAYWSRAHPGQTLEALLERDPAFGRIADTIGLSDQIQGVVEGFLDATPGVVGTALKTGQVIWQLVRDRRKHSQLVSECPPLAATLDEIEAGRVENALQGLPVVLTWDLAKRNGIGPTEVIVFWDEWENAQQNETVEDGLRRLVWSLPTVLFVLAGRRRLDWADVESGSQLGKRVWPNLISGSDRAPGQHRLGFLTPEDSQQYLEAVLQVNGKPVIDQALRDHIVLQAEGWPLYLDLAAVSCLRAVRRGEQLQSGSFGSFPELVRRMIRDLEPIERSQLRVASLVPSFTGELLVAGVTPTPSDSSVLHFMQREFIEESGRAWLSSQLHSRLRAAIRTEEIHASDSWSAREWTLAADRVLTFLEQATNNLLGSRPRPDWPTLPGFQLEMVSQLAEVLTAGLDASRVVGQVPDWLIQVATTLHEAGADEAILTAVSMDGRPEAGLGATSVVDEVARGLWAVARSRREGTSTVLPAMRAALAHRDLSPFAHGSIAIELGRVLTGTGDGGEAAAIYDDLGSAGGPLWRVGFRERGYMALWQGDFPRVLAVADQLSGDDRFDYWTHELRAETARATGLLEEAAQRSRRSLEAGELHNLVAISATTHRHLGRILALLDPAEALPVLNVACELNELLLTPVGLSQCYAAMAIARASSGELSLANELVRKSAIAAEQSGHVDATDHEFATCFLACLEGDRPRALRSVTALDDRALQTGHGAHWATAAAAWTREALGDAPTLSSKVPAWGVDSTAVVERWRSQMRRVISARSSWP